MMHVSQLSVSLIALNIGIGMAAPIVLYFFMHRKFGARFKTFLTGMLGMFVFALLLEQVLHALVLASPAGSVIVNNYWLYALYGGLAAGLFEETGRYLLMKVLLKDEHDFDANALMYGAGHGGFEVMYILVLGMVNNLVYSIMINSGQITAMLDTVEGDVRASVEAAIDSLINVVPGTFLLAPVERVGALVAQIALSVLVWFAVTRTKDRFLYPLAIFLHALLDAVSVLLMHLGLPLLAVEAVIWLMAAAYAWYAKKLWDARVSREALEEKIAERKQRKASLGRRAGGRTAKPSNITERANLNKRK